MSFPLSFEAGTPDYIGSTALAEALRYVDRIGIENIAAYEDELLRYATAGLNTIEGMRIFGQADHKRSGAFLFFVGKYPSLRYGDVAGPFGNSGSYRASLCPAFDACLRDRGDGAGAFSFYNT